ncbi:hypothetical protein TIFTF001_003953 [Ficus carica]|uniref:Uncharacterized protein n=1 Tax=Ficus carica TaxID=3494 RepID=A0AA87ZHV5_FICCA|nr:hypothetical protein TIFTF001_003953 [Ficus carica]
MNENFDFSSSDILFSLSSSFSSQNSFPYSRPPNHVVSDLVGHSTNVVSEVAPWRVLATIGDGSLRSRGGGARLCHQNPQPEASFRRPSKMGLEDLRPRGSVARVGGLDSSLGMEGARL